MNDIFIEETGRTPRIVGDSANGTLLLAGKSLPEDARSFYSEFRRWLMDFYHSEAKEIKITLDVEYFNTSTSNLLLEMMKQFKKMNETKKVTVLWLYEEDDIEMEEIGQDYKDLIGDIITLQPKKSQTA